MKNYKEPHLEDWNKYEKGIFVVIVLGIIFDTLKKKILIGRRVKDSEIKKLTWAFPGGKPEYHEDLDEAVKREVKEETNLDVESLGPIFAKTYPEKAELLSIYYLCEVKSGKEKAGEDFVELKWVSPDELEEYFSTSFHPKLKEYIMSLK
jgi:8-oxo-dGTP diphosphatase